jgi:hypothetical protein
MAPLVAEHNISYVSWWPAQDAGLTDKKLQKRKLFLEEDIEAEGAAPHVVYTLYDLDAGAMRNKWQEIREKPNAHYQLLRKSCSTIVLRVMKAGGALEKLPVLKRGWFGTNAYVTPKNVAQVCNELRDAGFASKDKDKGCPPKGGLSLGNVLGLR